MPPEKFTFYKDWTSCQYCDRFIEGSGHYIAVFDGDAPKENEKKKAKCIVVCDKCYNAIHNDRSFEKAFENWALHIHKGPVRMLSNKEISNDQCI